MSSSCWHLCDHSHNSLVCNRLVYITVTLTGYQHRQGIIHFWLFCMSITSVNHFILLNVCKYLAQYQVFAKYLVQCLDQFAIFCHSGQLLSPPTSSSLCFSYCEYVSVFVSFEILFPHLQDLCLDFYFLN